MFYFCECIVSDIIFVFTINSTLEICDNEDTLDRLELADESLEDAFKCTTPL